MVTHRPLWWTVCWSCVCNSINSITDFWFGFVFLLGSIEEEEIEEEGEEGVQSADDKIKAEQAKLEEDKKAVQDNHTMMAEVCIHWVLSGILSQLNAKDTCRWLQKTSKKPKIGVLLWK